MEQVQHKLEELNLSRDEVERIGDALKNKEFRKLFADYVEEIQDPENRKLYQEEIIQLEKERGIDVTFINPEPGYVIKTSVDGSKKAFINVCMNDNVQKPSSVPKIQEGSRGLQWSLPHSLAPPREDIDNKKRLCQVFDVTFHPNTLYLAEKNKAFCSMVNSIACEAVEKNFGVTLDKKNLKFPKLKYKGMAHPAIVRKPSGDAPIERTAEEKEFFDKLYEKVDGLSKESNKCYEKNEKSKKNNQDYNNCAYTTPKYVIKHKNHIDLQNFTGHRTANINATVPNELVIEVNLPLLKSSADISLDVTEKTVQLSSEKPAKYKLDLTLPYAVNQDIGNAKFDKDTKKLIVVLPVKRKLVKPIDLVGIEDEKCDQTTLETNAIHTKELIEEDTNKSGSERDNNCSHSISESSETLESIGEFSSGIVESSDKSEQVSPHEVSSFLDKSVEYSLPEYTWQITRETITFILNVKNVDQESISKIFDQAFSTIHLKFTSIGTNFFPVHYAFFVKFPGLEINEEDVVVETRKKKVTLKIAFQRSLEELEGFYVGVDSEDLSFIDIRPEESNASQEISLADHMKHVPIEEKDNGELCACMTQIQEEKEEEEEEQSVEFLNEEINSDATTTVLNDVSKEVEPVFCDSCDELSCTSSPSRRKGILKKFGRSKSESSIHDFDFLEYLSFDNHYSTIMECDTAEDGESSNSLKKTVRFKEVVSRQLYRTDASILGQKKKNQRKAKNRKKAQMRRASESEVYELEKDDIGKDLERCSLSQESISE